MVYGRQAWFIVYSLLFMEARGETKSTAISQSVGRSQGTALRNQMKTALLLNYSTILLKTDN